MGLCKIFEDSKKSVVETNNIPSVPYNEWVSTTMQPTLSVGVTIIIIHMHCFIIFIFIVFKFMYAPLPKPRLWNNVVPTT